MTLLWIILMALCFYSFFLVVVGVAINWNKKFANTFDELNKME